MKNAELTGGQGRRYNVLQGIEAKRLVKQPCLEKMLGKLVQAMFQSVIRGEQNNGWNGWDKVKRLKPSDMPLPADSGARSRDEASGLSGQGAEREVTAWLR